MDAIVGIDLGTTTSRVAVIENGAPVIIKNSESNGTTPSYVAITADGKRLVGEAARRYAVGNPENVIFAVKRLIGRRYADPVVQDLKQFMPFQIVELAGGDAWVRVENKDYSPEQITAFILQKMKKTAEDYLVEPITKAVITVPAYFSDQQRQSTKDAAAIAGLDVIRLESEPTVAALAYGLHRQHLGQTIVVYDLGGGTFDVSVLEIGDGVYEVKSTSGDMSLGGEDFDFRLMDHLSDIFKKSHHVDLMSNALARQRLKQAAEDAKIDLSFHETTIVDLPFIHSIENKAFHLRTEIDRATFEGLIKDLVDRSITVCARALKDAALAPAEIQEVILVGGSTRIPRVQNALREYFGREPYGELRREDAVALGAAIRAGVLSGNVRDALLLDVTPFSLGLETLGGVFTRTIERNTTIPTKKSQVFSTGEDNQTAVTIRVAQGEGGKFEENTLLGQFDLVGIALAPRGVPQIEVIFDLDANGIANVSARDKATGQEQSIRVHARGGLSQDDIARMREDAERVGVSHPSIIPPVNVPTGPAKPERAEDVEPPPVAVASPPLLPTDASRGTLKLFLSYAQKDEQWANAVRDALGVLANSGKAKIANSRHTSAAERADETSTDIEESNVALLLLSNDFLNSASILAHELPAILAENERRGLHVIPIIARPCAYEQHRPLSKFKLFNEIDRPLSSLTEWALELELARLTNVVAAVFDRSFQLTDVGEEAGIADAHAVVIAAANYRDAQRLPEAVLNDARDIVAVLSAADYCGYDPTKITILLDEKATLGAIRQALADLASASSPNGTVFIFFSGHGARVTRDGTEASVLMSIDSRPTDLRGTSLSEADFSKALAAIPAKRLVVVLDACHAGGAVVLKGDSGAAVENGLEEKTLARLADGTGRVILASCRADEKSIVRKGARNSVFTQRLLEALKGEARTRGDGLIRIFEVFEYVSENVWATVEERQHPIFKAGDLEDNFPVALDRGGVNAAPGRAIPLRPAAAAVRDA